MSSCYNHLYSLSTPSSHGEFGHLTITAMLLTHTDICAFAHTRARRHTHTHLWQYGNNTNDIPWVPQSIKEGLTKRVGKRGRVGE